MNRRNKKIAYNILVCSLLLIAIIWVFSRFVHLGNVEYTDNAQVKQLIIPVNSRIQGFVSKIYFSEYQEVKKGDTLAIIEDSEFKYRLAQAVADYERATSGKKAMKTSIHTAENNISISDAAIEETRILVDNAEREYLRYKNLYENSAVTKQQYDATKTNYDALKARYEQLKHAKESFLLWLNKSILNVWDKTLQKSNSRRLLSNWQNSTSLIRSSPHLVMDSQEGRTFKRDN